ncbi:group II intron maturase-specific domain-containing protein [Ornithinibacillus halophilus]|uniref:group II intron maturase-specific domain-containing protein n=1 Tax=Ornithinibacillus halophilus TaxID=930117 RepID=UPI001160643A
MEGKFILLLVENLLERCDNTVRKTIKSKYLKRPIQRFKSKVRELTSRKEYTEMEERIRKLNLYLVGSLGY